MHPTNGTNGHATPNTAPLAALAASLPAPDAPDAPPAAPAEKRSHHKKTEGADGADRGRGRPGALGSAAACTPEALGALDLPALTATVQDLQSQASDTAFLIDQKMTEVEALEKGEVEIKAALHRTVAMIKAKGQGKDARAAMEKSAQRAADRARKAADDAAALAALLDE